MKISVNNCDCFELNETQEKVIKNDIHKDLFEEDMKRRLQYILTHKYEECFKRLKAEWEPILIQKGIEMIPTNADKLAELIFSQPEYKCKAKRDEKND